MSKIERQIEQTEGEICYVHTHQDSPGHFQGSVYYY